MAEQAGRAGRAEQAGQAEQSEQWDVMTSVGLTALGVAAGRSIESHRPDGLVDDPLAERFVRAVELEQPFPLRVEEITEEQLPVWGVLSRYMGVRSRFFDDCLLAASRDGIRQIVLLAAGLDARPYRLETADDQVWFEVDQPKVLEFKQQVAEAAGARERGARRTVPADLREDWPQALLDAGFDAQRPTAWLAEGLLGYLSAQAEADLFDRVRELSAPGSRICAESPDSSGRATSMDDWRQRHDQQLGIDMRRLVNVEERVDCADRLRSAGWQVTVDGVSDVAQDLGVPLEGETGERVGRGRFVTAGR